VLASYKEANYIKQNQEHENKSLRKSHQVYSYQYETSAAMIAMNHAKPKNLSIFFLRQFMGRKVIRDPVINFLSRYTPFLKLRAFG
jgi:hypothetical protein